MPFEFGFGNIGDDVIVKVGRHFQIVATTVRALRGPNVVFDKRGSRRRLGPKEARMFAMFLAPPVFARSLPRDAVTGSSLASLVNDLQLVLELRQPPPQLGILGFQLGNAIQ
jgi:hypothetical protein